MAPSKRQKVPNDVHCNVPAQQELQAANTNPISDVVEMDDNSKQPGVQEVYKILRKTTGNHGGSSSHGPIYGELTAGSMQKMVELMKQHTDLDSSSIFLDVGSGIGKPNFHVANDPGVQVSLGLEVNANRYLLSMNCLLATLEFATQDIIMSKKNEMTLVKQQRVKQQLAKQKCMFVHGDIRTVKTFNPFTHVYMFSTGFPPKLWKTLAAIWNDSSTPYLICFQSEKDLVQKYEFDVELLAQTKTTMHGSNEGKTGYVYCRKKPAEPSDKMTSTTIDPLFSEAVEILEGGFDRILEWAKKLKHKNLHSGGPHAYTRQQSRGTGQSERTAHREQNQHPTEGQGQHQILPSHCHEQKMTDDKDKIPRKSHPGQNHNAGQSKGFGATNDNVGRYNDSSRGNVNNASRAPGGCRDDRGRNNYKDQCSQGGRSSGGNVNDRGGRYPARTPAVSNSSPGSQARLGRGRQAILPAWCTRMKTDGAVGKSSAAEFIHDSKVNAHEHPTSVLMPQDVEKEGNLAAHEHPTLTDSLPVSEDEWNQLSVERKMVLLLPNEATIWGNLVAEFPSDWEKRAGEAVRRTLEKTKKVWDNYQTSQKQHTRRRFMRNMMMVTYRNPHRT